MKKIHFTIALILISFISFAQNQSNFDNMNSSTENSIYQLFPTKNIWTFIKLDTRNGKMWQVHFTVSKDGVQTELILNPISLVDKQREAIGRFTLYPTENIYNFLLLDKIDGTVYQTQWSMDAKERIINKIE